MVSFVPQVDDQETDPVQPPEVPVVTPMPKGRKQGKKLDNLKELGQIEIPPAPNNIHCISIVGQIEGQPSLPKTLKYWFCE